MAPLMELLEKLSSGPQGMLLGALIGVIISAVFEDHLVRYRQRFTRAVGRMSGKIRNRVLRRDQAQADTFSIGGVRTPIHIVEGDGAQVIDEQRMSVIVNHEFAALPDDFRPWTEEIAAEQEERSGRGEQAFWNGPNYAVEGLSISRSALDELPEICLRLKESDYFSFLATQQLDREFPDGTTPRNRYLQENDPENVPTFMSCSFGTNVALVTADNQLIVARRSHRVGSRPNLWSSSANEGLSRQLDSDGRSAPDIYRVMRRGVDEELSISREEYRLELLAITVERHVHQWGAFFTGTLHTLTGSDVLARRSRGVPDKWESAELRLVPFTPASVFTFVAQEYKKGTLTPHLPVLVYLALVRRYGQRAVERNALGVLRRHGLA